jgi:hypothetical protein
MTRLLVLLALGGLLATFSPQLASAQDPGGYAEPSGRDIVVAYNVGWRFSLAPGVIIPTNGGGVGWSLAGDLRYGFNLGQIILAPGGRLMGLFPAHATALAALATTRLTVPIGPVGPYVQAGVGPGWVSDPSRAGLAWLAGGGFMVHFGVRFALGAEATYQAITGTGLNVLFVGPTFLVGF